MPMTFLTVDATEAVCDHADGDELLCHVLADWAGSMLADGSDEAAVLERLPLAAEQARRRPCR